MCVFSTTTECFKVGPVQMKRRKAMNWCYLVYIIVFVWFLELVLYCIYILAFEMAQEAHQRIQMVCTSRIIHFYFYSFSSSFCFIVKKPCLNISLCFLMVGLVLLSGYPISAARISPMHPVFDPCIGKYMRWYGGRHIEQVVFSRYISFLPHEWSDIATFIHTYKRGYNKLDCFSIIVK